MIKAINKKKYFSEIEYKNQTYKIENEIIIKYKISVGKSFDSETWSKIINENNYYYFDRLAKNKLRKLLTEKELTDFLFDLNAPKDVVNYLITKYKKYNLINDVNYTEIYINNNINRYGPKIIVLKLKDKGINYETITNQLNEINEEEYIIKNINKMIDKNNKFNRNQLKNHILKTLVNKGYNYNLIINNLDVLLSNINIDEEKLIINDYRKMLKKYQNKKESWELKSFIKNKLFQKGYSASLINKIIENENV